MRVRHIGQLLSIDAVTVSAQLAQKRERPHDQGVSHTPSGGLIPPTFAQHPPASGGNEGERGRGGRGKGKGRGEGKGRDPQGLVDTPMFQILKNPLRMPSEARAPARD